MSYNKIVYETKDDSDTIPLRIQPLKTNPVRKLHHEKTDNYQEFKKIYGNLIKKNFGKKSPRPAEIKVSKSRPRVEVKTIQLEMPLFGNEKAVIYPPKQKTQATKAPAPRPQKRSLDEKSESSATNEIMRKLSQIENILVKDSKNNLHKCNSTFIDITNRELHVANEQLRHIKELIDKRHEEIQTDQKNITLKIKKKNRHAECEKKHATTLSSLRRKLKDMEEKYLKKPQVVFRSVNERYTQSSLETLYKNQTFSSDAKFDDSVEAAISELQNNVNDKCSKPDKTDVIPNGTESPKLNISSEILQYLQNDTTPTDSPDKISTQSKDISTNSREMYSQYIDDFLAGKHEPANCLYTLFSEDINKQSNIKNQAPTDKNFQQNDFVRITQNMMGDCKHPNIVKSSTKSVSFNLSGKKDYLPAYELEKYTWPILKEEIGKQTKDNIEEQGKMCNESIGDGTHTVKKYNFDEFKLGPNKNSFKRNNYDDSTFDSGDAISKFIDSSEKRLNKYRNIRQDVVDINAFCETLCDITKSDDEENEIEYKKELEELNKQMLKEAANIEEIIDIQNNGDKKDCREENIFDNTNLQNSVLNSCFLRKEFNIQPKLFTEDQYNSPQKKQFLQIEKQYKKPDENCMKNLFDNLEFALKNSVYTVGDAK